MDDGHNPYENPKNLRDPGTKGPSNPSAPSLLYGTAVVLFSLQQYWMKRGVLQMHERMRKEAASKKCFFLAFSCLPAAAK